MKSFRPVVHVCLALSLVACASVDDLSFDAPEMTADQTLRFEFPPASPVEHRLPRASGGIPPYDSGIDDCPDWVTLFPDQGILAGTAPDSEQGRVFFCTYTVTDSAFFAPQSTTFGLQLVVGPAVRLALPPATDQMFIIGIRRSVTLPEASGGVPPYTYTLTCRGGMLPSGVGFVPDTLVLGGTAEAVFRDSCTYAVTDSWRPAATVSWDIEVTSEKARPLALPPVSDQEFVIGTYREVTLPAASGGVAPYTYSFTCEEGMLPPGVGFAPARRVLAGNANEDFRYSYYCTYTVTDSSQPAATVSRDVEVTSVAASSRARVSNPVHSALAPVHARRAVDVARAAIRDRVRGWSPEAPHGFAISAAVGFASLSGLSEGFDYTGSSESLSGGVELGADAWQVGLVGSFTRTDLRYRAATGLAGSGYRAGEHDTEMLSVHPFAAWHAPSGGHLWASFGVGEGELRHRDDLGFRSWSRSDVRLRAWAAGTSVPLARVLSGELDAEAGIESFAFEIEGGDRISAALPTVRGRDYRAGLAWNAPVSGAPFLSLAYRRSTGDGPEGDRVEARGSVSAEGILDPRLTVTGSAAASFGLGDYEQDSWRIGGDARFAPGGLGRGFRLDLDIHLMSLDGERPAGVGVRGEAGYGLWSEPLLGTVRPYVGVICHPGDTFIRRTVGLNLRDTPTTRVKVEVHDHRRDASPALELTLRHRF